ncbi:MAG: hypothetical protein IJ766_06305 [Clostridia bacterium]|nr:hypothetical protein [Clostridia bacterium]
MKKTLNPIRRIPQGQMILWLAIRCILIIYAVYCLFAGDTTGFLMGVFSVGFSHLWDLFQLLGGQSFITRVDYFSQTLLNCFLLVGCMIGPFINNHTNFEHIDIFEHTFAGILAAWFGYDLATAIQGRKHHLKPALAALFSFWFSLGLAVAWEFYEFTMDRVYGYQLQRSSLIAETGLRDTMVDLICCAVGALIGMFLVAFKKNGVIGKGRKALRRQVKAQSKADRAEELAYLAEKARNDNYFSVEHAVQPQKQEETQ